MKLFIIILFYLGFADSVHAEKEKSQLDQVEEYNKIQKCIKKVQNICQDSQDKNCPQKKWGQLPAKCQQYSDAAIYMNPDNIASGNIPGPMGGCLKQMEKMCKFDNKLAEKNLTKAAKKYQSCVENAAPKLKGECKKLLNIP